MQNVRICKIMNIIIIIMNIIIDNNETSRLGIKARLQAQFFCDFAWHLKNGRRLQPKQKILHKN